MSKLDLHDEIEDRKELRRQQKAEERNRKKQRDYDNTMITRAEARVLSSVVAQREAKNVVDFLKEPLQVNLIQTMALVDILLKKGIITQDDLTESLTEVSMKLQKHDEQSGEQEHAE